MNKRSILVILLFILMSVLPLASAALNETKEKAVVNSAYLWLDKQVKGNYNLLSADDLALSIYALAYDSAVVSEGKKALIAKSQKSECWPSQACRIKTTALAMMALNKIGENVDPIASWMMRMQKAYTTTGVTWMLQIDSDEDSNCTIAYDSKTYSLNLNKDKTYSWQGTSSPCFSITNGNYWLEISKSCLEKSFSVTCSKPSVVSLPYKVSNILYVPSESFSSPATVSIKTVCLKEGTECSYDSTMWAAFALKQAGKDYASLMPYLIEQSDNNRKFMSDAMMYVLTSKEDYALDVLSQQSADGYWSDIGGFGKYYDTALAVNSIKDYSSQNVTKSKEWLVNENRDGSWGTTARIRDTALILGFVWPQTVVVTPGNDCQEIYDFVCAKSCLSTEEIVPYSCLSPTDVCCKPAGAKIECKKIADCRKPECKGNYVEDTNGIMGKCEYPKETNCNDEFDNDYNSLVDMNDPACKETCAEKFGRECEEGTSCSESTIRAYDTDRCCLGRCEAVTETCEEKKGVVCREGEECEDGQWTSATDSERCCLTRCKGKLNIWIIVIIALMAGLGAATYLLYKKGFFSKYFGKQKPKTMQIPEGIYRPAIRPISTAQQPITVPSKPPVMPSIQQSQKAPPQRFTPEIRREGVKREIKSDLDETMKKLKKLAEK